MTEVALNGPLTVEQRDSLQTIRTSADWLLATISSVLEFARVEGASISIQNALWQPRQMVEELVALLASTAHQKVLELVVDLDASVPDEAWGDGFRVRQVVNTLLGNAIKFTDAGSVSLEIQHAVGALTVVVRDTGIGISEADQARIFEAFTRIDGSLSRRGTGLGLALARELTSAMGGTLTLSSQPGQGSAFRFVVPVRAVEPAAPRARTLEGERCAVLSALPVAQAMLERVLVEQGATITDSAQASLVVIDVPVREPNAWLDSLRPVSARSVALVAEGQQVSAELKRHALVSVVGKTRLRAMVEALASARSMPTPVPAPPEPPASVLQLPAPGRLVPVVASGLPCTALMAEDNPVNAKVLLRLLERLGIHCEVVPDGVEAVRRAGEQAFEVIFMDLNMPRMDGLEATRQIRASGQTLPIIAVTARVSSEDEEECLQAGMTAYLAKPVNVKRLEELVHQTLPRLRAARG
jgi:CheY-like chemotaxis protein